MPLWDSVQRSLEKASQEAARIAKTQRLRSTIDGLGRQLSTQNAALLNKTMDLFNTGQLTQNELLPLCQEMMHLQQQLNQAQAELRQIQNSQAPTTGTPPPPVVPPTELPHPYTSPVPGSNDQAAHVPPPPAYQLYPDSNQPVTIPPPPPGVEPLTVGSIETIEIGSGAMPIDASHNKRFCAICQSELPPDNAFCHNCGAPVQDMYVQHSPTMRSGAFEQAYQSTQATVRADEPAPGAGPAEEHASSTITGSSERSEEV